MNEMRGTPPHLGRRVALGARQLQQVGRGAAAAHGLLPEASLPQHRRRAGQPAVKGPQRLHAPPLEVLQPVVSSRQHSVDWGLRNGRRPGLWFRVRVTGDRVEQARLQACVRCIQRRQHPAPHSPPNLLRCKPHLLVCGRLPMHVKGPAAQGLGFTLRVYPKPSTPWTTLPKHSTRAACDVWPGVHATAGRPSPWPEETHLSINGCHCRKQNPCTPEVGAAVGHALDGHAAQPHLVAGQRSRLVGKDVRHAPQVLDDVAVARLGPVCRARRQHLGVVGDEVALQQGEDLVTRVSESVPARCERFWCSKCALQRAAGPLAEPQQRTVCSSDSLSHIDIDGAPDPTLLQTLYETMV